MKKLFYLFTLFSILLHPLNILAIESTPQNQPQTIQSSTELSEEELHTKLSPDFLTLYELQKEQQGNSSYTLNDFIQEEYLLFYDANTIWDMTDPLNDYTGVFIGRDLTGIELFENLEDITLVFVGPIENYNLQPLANLSHPLQQLTVIYEPKLLSDHANGAHYVENKYIYDEQLEKNLVVYLNSLSETLEPGSLKSLFLGAGMSHLPRMYDYTWLKGFFEKGIHVEKMEQHGPENNLIIDYDIVFHEDSGKYTLDFAFDSPYSGIEMDGSTINLVDYFGIMTPNEKDMFASFFLYQEDGTKIDILAEEPWTGFDKITRIEASFILDDNIDSYYDENGIPYAQSPYYLLPSRITQFSLQGTYDVVSIDGDITPSMLMSSLTLFMDLPLYVDLNVNPHNLSIDTTSFNKKDLHQLVKNNQKLNTPTGNLIQDEYMLEG